MKEKIRETALKVMVLNSIGMIFMTAIQLFMFDLKGQIALTVWCGASYLIEEYLSGRKNEPKMTFPALMTLINSFMLMYIPSNAMGKITAIALAIFVIYFGLKAKESLKKEIK
jgi:hypothetical protein